MSLTPGQRRRSTAASSGPLTVRQLIAALQAAKNHDMVVAVCDRNVPYRQIVKVFDGTGSFAASEAGTIDGVFLLFCEAP